MAGRALRDGAFGHFGDVDQAHLQQQQQQQHTAGRWALRSDSLLAVSLNGLERLAAETAMAIQQRALEGSSPS